MGNILTGLWPKKDSTKFRELRVLGSEIKAELCAKKWRNRSIYSECHEENGNFTFAWLYGGVILAELTSNKRSVEFNLEQLWHLDSNKEKGLNEEYSKAYELIEKFIDSKFERAEHSYEGRVDYYRKDVSAKCC